MSLNCSRSLKDVSVERLIVSLQAAVDLPIMRNPKRTQYQVRALLLLHHSTWEVWESIPPRAIHRGVESRKNPSPGVKPWHKLLRQLRYEIVHSWLLEISVLLLAFGSPEDFVLFRNFREILSVWCNI